MLNIKRRFHENIKTARNLSGLYTSLVNAVGGPTDYTDLLRTEIVYSVSALDKLVHEVVIFGCMEIFSGRRLATPRFNSETISFESHIFTLNNQMPPPEKIFETEISKKLYSLSFQTPDNISHALSLIYPEKHKWDKIAAQTGADKKDMKTKLTLIVTRRNSIVHEFDIDPVSGRRQTISLTEATDATNLVEKIGDAIVTVCT